MSTYVNIYIYVYTHTYVYTYINYILIIYIYICMSEVGGVIDPNREIGFGSVAVRCVAVAVRCGAMVFDALRLRYAAMRCDAKMCVRVKRG